MMEAELIQVTRTATKHTNESFLSRLGGFFSFPSLEIERWLWIGWVASFGSNHHQSSSHLPQFSQDEKSNRQPPVLA
jgi:hypothetical protein